LLNAQQSLATTKPDAAITTLESLRQQFPDTAATMKGDVLLYGLYLDKNDAAHALAVGNDVLKQWPRTEAAWSVISANCEQLAKTSTTQALVALEKAANDNLLPLSEHYQAVALRLKYMQTARPDDFLPTGMKVMARMPTLMDPHELPPIAEIAARLYAPLMAAKRFDDAKSITDSLQEKLALLGAASAVTDSDTAAYLAALADVDPARYLAAMKAMLAAVAWAETDGEYTRAVTLAKQGYAVNMRAKLFDDARQMHVKIQQALAKHPYTDTLRKQDIGNYLHALQAADTT